MKLIIDISKEMYKNLQKRSIEIQAEGYLLENSVLNGTPLPKGHGRLIDADALEKLCYEHEIGNSAFDGEPIIEQGQYDDGDNIWKSLFDFAPTIIEADTESVVKNETDN